MPPIKASPWPIPAKPAPQACPASVSRPPPSKPAPQVCLRSISKQPKTVVEPRITTAQAYFGYLQQMHQSKSAPKPVKVVLSAQSNSGNGKDYLDLCRIDGKKLRVNPGFMACFYDLNTCDVMAILRISERSFNHIKVFCKLAKWPKQLLLRGQGLLTVSNVRQSRLNWMKWSYEQRDEFTYELLHRAHQCAGCSVADLPSPCVVSAPRPVVPVQQPEPEHDRQPEPEPDPQPEPELPQNVPVPVPCEQQPPLDLEGVDWSQLFM